MDTVVEILQLDPAMAFSLCDGPTQQSYLDAVRQLSRKTGVPEVQIARAVVAQCAKARGRAPRDHVGWALVGDGRAWFEASFQGAGHGGPVPGMSPSRTARTVRFVAACLVVSAVVLAGLAVLILCDASLPARVTGLVLCVPLAMHLGHQAVRWAIQAATPTAAELPCLRLASVPPEHQTCVVYPVILSNVDAAHALVETMRLNYLAEPVPGVRHLLLVDLPDHSAAHGPDDAAILRRVKRAVAALNRGYAGRPFLVLHRRRLWNECDKVWMGWERKRGKLEEFNRLVVGQGQRTSFVVGAEVARYLTSIRYAITLDEDARLTAGTVVKLIGTIAHPLHRPVFSDDGTRLVSGYTIVRPRKDSASDGTVSLFQLVEYGKPAADYVRRIAAQDFTPPLQTAVGEDWYVGQGIYDVTAFHALLDGRIPECSVLSHDKLEGMILRAACRADAVILECPPGDYRLYRSRYHRWVRGDFHLLPWLFRAGRGRPAISLLGRWIILWDLLSHLRYPFSVLLLVLGWIGAFGVGYAIAATVGIVVALGDDAMRKVCTRLVRFALPLVDRSARRTVDRGGPRPSTWLRTATRVVVRIAIQASLLADMSIHVLDAICRALYRTARRRRVLQWTSAANEAQILHNGWRGMAASPVISVACAVTLVAISPVGAIVAAPMLISWFLAPLVATSSARRYPLSGSLQPRFVSLLLASSPAPSR